MVFKCKCVDWDQWPCCRIPLCSRASLVSQKVKNPPAMQETWIRSLGWEDLLEELLATHSSILAWRIPCTEEPAGLQSMGSQRIGHVWVTKHIHTLLQLGLSFLDLVLGVAMPGLDPKWPMFGEPPAMPFAVKSAHRSISVPTAQVEGLCSLTPCPWRTYTAGVEGQMTGSDCLFSAAWVV